MKKKKCISMVLAAILSISLAACGQEAPSGATTSNAISTASGDMYKKGDTAEGKGFSITVDSLDATPEFLNYVDADAGCEFFFVSFELENTSEKPLETNTFFTIYADGAKCETILFYDPYDGVDWFDTYTDLEPGRKVKSYISATVPEAWNEIELECADGTAFSFARTDLGTMSATENSGEDAVYHVGETMTRNGMQITITSATQTDYIPDFGSFYYEPAEGNHYVILMMDVTNGSNVPQKFDVSNAFDVYTVDYSAQFTWFLGTDIEGYNDLNDQDSVNIVSGKSISGYKVLEVPDGWQKIELTSRQGTIEITPDVVTVQ